MIVTISQCFMYLSYHQSTREPEVKILVVQRTVERAGQELKTVHSGATGVPIV